MLGQPTYIGVRARSDLGGRRPVCPKKLRSAPLLDCRNQSFTPSKCTKKHAFTIVERHKIVRNRNTVFRTSHTLCRFTRSSNDRVTKQATRCSKCQRSTEQQQSIKCFKIHSKDLLQNNDFHITSSIFLLSSVLVFYFFLILFFNSIVYRFFIARIFGVLPEYFRDWGGCRPPRPPGSYAYAHLLIVGGKIILVTVLTVLCFCWPVPGSQLWKRAKESERERSARQKRRAGNQYSLGFFLALAFFRVSTNREPGTGYVFVD